VKTREHTPEEWQQLLGITVRDPDGWRGDHGRDWRDPIDYFEFYQRMAKSTVTMSRKGKPVRIILDRGSDGELAVREGVIIAISSDGEVCYEADGIRTYAWPLLDIEALPEPELTMIDQPVDAMRGRAEALARRFHEAYERLAPQFGYETREASAKPWAEVPENNRQLMTAVCAELLARADAIGLAWVADEGRGATPAERERNLDEARE
jgi:hypothetical protein